jgi:hypothetical protein
MAENGDNNDNGGNNTSRSTSRSISVRTYFEILKGIIFLFFCGCLIFGGLKVYAWFDRMQYNQAEADRVRLEEARKYQEYSSNVVKAHTEIVNSLKADIERLRKEGDDARRKMLDDIKKRDEKIVNLGEVVATLEGKSKELRVASDRSYEGKSPGDPNAYDMKFIEKRFTDAKGNEQEVPVAWAMYYPNRPEDKRWKVAAEPLEYHTIVIQSEQKDGQFNTHLDSWAFNTRTKEKIPMKIEMAEFKQLKKEDKEFFWWAPRFSLNVDLGVGTSSLPSSSDSFVAAGGLSFSMMGYGRTTNDLTWRFLDFGVSTNGDTTYAKFTPFTYNIGEVLPLVNNLFVGPFVGYAFSGDNDWIVGVGISIPF